MKKKIIFAAIGIAAVLGLSGCQFESGQNQSTEAQEELTNQEQESREASDEAALEGKSGEQEEAETYLVENPKDGYFEGRKLAAEPDFGLRLLDQRQNGIGDEEEWFSHNRITKPSFPYTDQKYEYRLQGDNDHGWLFLEVYDLEKERTAARLDYSKYQYAEDFKEEYRDYVDQNILWAKEQDGILYASIAHNTYASFSPHTAYVTAIDLKDGRVVWKSEPLMCNSNSFEIIAGSVVCGYGFTNEEDFLNILDKRTGELQAQLPLASKPEYIVRKEDVLYVRTYDTSYSFEIAVPGASASKRQEDSIFLRNYDGSYEKEVTLADSRIRYRMVVVDAALGSRLYGLIRSDDDGISWEEVNMDPFKQETGMGIDFTFLDELLGFAALAHNGGDSAELFVTQDGGKSYSKSDLEEVLVVLDNGESYPAYDYPRMPYWKDGELILLCGQGADGDYDGGDENGLARYISQDNGQSFFFDRISRDVD